MLRTFFRRQPLKARTQAGRRWFAAAPTSPVGGAKPVIGKAKEKDDNLVIFALGAVCAGLMVFRVLMSAYASESNLHLTDKGKKSLFRGEYSTQYQHPSKYSRIEDN